MNSRPVVGSFRRGHLADPRADPVMATLMPRPPQAPSTESDIQAGGGTFDGEDVWPMPIAADTIGAGESQG